MPDDLVDDRPADVRYDEGDAGALIRDQEYDPAIPLDSITEHPDNPNEGDDEAIGESIDAHGFYGAVVVQRSTGRILIGNTRYRAMRTAGAETVPGFWIDCDDTEALELLAVDNRARDLSVYATDRLASLLQAIQTQREGDPDPLRGTLFASGDLDTLLETLRPGDGVGTARDSRTPAERAADHEASPIRSIILPLTLGDYDDAVELLGRLRRSLEVDSNAEVVMYLLREAVAGA